MIWIKNYFPRAGMIRIPVSDIYHYAVYISDDEIIQFGEPPSPDNKIPDANVRVCVTTLKELIYRAEYVEGASLEGDEQFSALPPDEIIRRARSLIGSGGYSFLFNNCEHFAYNCIFGKPYSTQTEALRKRFMDIPVVDVYVAQIPTSADYSTVYPCERYDEICSVSNEAVKAEKYYAWRLLSIAVERSLGYAFEGLKFKKEDNGKWTSDRCEFSISHSSGVVSVAVSKKPIGIDIELIRRVENAGLAKRILSPDEYSYFKELSEPLALDYIIKMWTIKEAFYKYNSTGVFSPCKTVIDDKLLHTEKMNLFGKDFYLSIVNEDICKVRIFSDIKL